MYNLYPPDIAGSKPSVGLAKLPFDTFRTLRAPELWVMGSQLERLVPLGGARRGLRIESYGNSGSTAAQMWLRPPLKPSGPADVPSMLPE